MSNSDPDKNLDYEHKNSVSDIHASVEREKDDPQAGLEPATLGVFACCAVFLLLGGAYLGANGGFNSSSVFAGYTPQAPDVEDAGGAEMTVAKWLKSGKGVYSNCQACHGANGLGISADHPPLAGSEWVNEGTERLAALIIHGLKGPITVAGKGYSSAQVMPDHKDKMDATQIAQVMSYIRSSWGNEAETIVSTAMVENAFEKFAGREGNYTADELPPADAYLEGELPEWAGGAPKEEPTEAKDGEGEPEPASDAPGGADE